MISAQGKKCINITKIQCLDAEVQFGKDGEDVFYIPAHKKEIKQFFNSLQIAAVHKNNLKF